MIQPWKKISSQSLGNFHVFKVRGEHKMSPRTGVEHDFFVIESVNWVNVIAITPDHQVILVEQYRHGSDSVELEVPGGVMDAADASPEATALRELREETGYEGERAQIIGDCLPNPAIMNNRCYVVLIENCVCKHPTQFDHAEDILTRVVPVADIPALVASGKIRHSLVIAAFHYFNLWRSGVR